MKRFLLFLIFICPAFSFSQIEEQGEGAVIQLYVYNNTNQKLTLLLQNRHDNTDPSLIVDMPALDTVQFPFKLELDEDQVPQNKYRFRIYESPYYYFIDDHYYWECERIVDENYNCYHTLKPSIVIDTTRIFDSLAFRMAEQVDSTIYESYALDEQASYAGGFETLMPFLIESLGLASEELKVLIGVELIVEKDGSVSKVSVLRSTHEDLNEKVIAVCRELEFIPGKKSTKTVRTKVVFPIRSN